MKPTALIHKAAGLPLDVKSISEDGEFEGYASRFGQADSGEDIVVKGAFKASLRQRPATTVKMLRDHMSSELIGRWDVVKEDDTGLFCKGKLLHEVAAKAKETLGLMRAGVLDGLSIGFKTVRAKYDNKTNQRHILEADLWEISVVTFPMLTSARVTAVKAAEAVKSIREFEDWLRDAGGFSIARAKAIASAGFKSANPRDEGGAFPPNGIGALAAQIAQTLRS